MLKEAFSRITDIFLPTVLRHGKEYQQKGHVLNFRLSDGLLKARVKGRSGQIYNVHMDLKSWPAQAAQCSCTYSFNCKHAAASLFALQARENDIHAGTSSSESDVPLQEWTTSLYEKDLEKKAISPTHVITYLLEPHLSDYGHRVIVRFALAKCLKKGGLGKKIFFHTITESRKQYFAPSDEEIIAAFLLKSDWFDCLETRNSDLLEKILATGRAYLANTDETGLILGRALNVRMKWQLNLDGSQSLTFVCAKKNVSPLFLDKAWYYDNEANCLGLLISSYSMNQLKTLLNLPSVALEQVSLVSEKLAEVDRKLPPPKMYEKREIQVIKPQPVIIFDAIEIEEYFSSNDFLFIVELLFDYDGKVISIKETSPSLFSERNDSLLEVPRDLEYEKKIFKELKQILPCRSLKPYEKLFIDNGEELLLLKRYKNSDDLPHLYSQVIPLLKSKQWRVEFVHPVYEELIDADELDWFSEIDDAGNDFFSYQLGILVEGKQVSIVPLVATLIGQLDSKNLDSLSDEERVKLPLPDGKFLNITLGRIKPLMRFLLQYGVRHIKENQSLQIERYQLVLMQETEQAMACISARWQGSEALRSQLQQLVTLNRLPAVEIPQGLKTTLRDYQHQGLNWLQFLRLNHFGGILADDMGLGKTVQTLAHLQVEKEQGRLTKASLIIAPTSLIGNWFEEAKRFTPALKILIFHGAERHEDSFDNYDLIISTYGLIQRDKTRFVDYLFYYLILDEAQSIKNARTKTTQIIQQIKATHRLCLSGTPLENDLGELWSLFHFLMPGLLGDLRQFRQFFRTPIEKSGDMERKTLLAKRVQPFMLRRSKNQVMSELPAKTEMIRTVELAGSQRDLYEAIRMSMEKKVREAIAKQGMGKSHIVLLDALLKLRQVCCDPRLLTVPGAEIAQGTSVKLDTLMELLDNLMEEGRRVLIFSQFTSMLRLIEEELIKRNYLYLKLTGQTQNRQALVHSFQEGKAPIFLISLKAGGTGLNLTRADTVIHYDPWWNPAVEEQATDRSHRIGQENPVFVYKLITSGTVEEAILSMQAKKRQLFEGILSDNATGTMTLTANDVEQFFMPLTE
ncbi:DEAD/DEAH box helicase [Legionella fairfieldensis]|uniref:DEAD/DEAH box helicase n=1 Tax=Legionella fairfieldensis TaxID=45064 RepID=UPI00048C7D86|nr:DEAD/DEAH box helicase [Legionella fairfieldensis]